MAGAALTPGVGGARFSSAVGSCFSLLHGLKPFTRWFLNINSVSVGCAPCVTLCSLEVTEISERGAEPQGGWNVEPGSSHCLKKGRDECGGRHSDPCGVPGVVVVSRLSMPPSGALLSKASSRWEAESGAVNKAPRGWVPSHVHLQLHQGRFLSGHAPSQLRNISE